MKTMQAKPVIAVSWLLLLSGVASAQKPKYTVIHNFASYPRGAAPYSPLIRDAQGSLYGTTTLGGGAGNAGVVYKLDAAGHQTIIYTFTGGPDGGNPFSGLTADAAGNYYGTTYQGGAAGAGAKQLGAGVVYKIDAAGHYSVLYTFTGGADGSGPYAGVTLDAAGNLYGTTYYGGKHDAGAVYRVTPAGQESVLHSFGSGNDGANPYGGVTFGPDGALYGATYNGSRYALGVIYKVDLSGKETVLHAFHGGVGNHSYSDVIFDSAGNLYGGSQNTVFELSAAGHYSRVAYFPGGPSSVSAVIRDQAGNFYGVAGTGFSPGTWGWGGVFKVDTAGKVHRLYLFPGIPTGAPSSYSLAAAGLVLGPTGEMYGATSYGGLAGIVYAIDAHGNEKTLYSFPAARGGTGPSSGVIRDGAGNLYGTTAAGGAGNQGVVFKIDTAGHEKVLHTFAGGTDGARPQAALVQDAAGNLYGTTVAGGPANAGTIFKIDASGNETVLYSFTGGADGWFPNGLVLDPSGNLFGTTLAGGVGSQTGVQEGVVFKLDSGGNFSVLYSFTGLADGGAPEAGLVRDPQGNFYGTTYGGGGAGDGVIFTVDAGYRYSVLHSFQPESDGGNPFAGLTLDAAGNLYGTTANYPGGGTAFELDAARNYKVLFYFGNQGCLGAGCGPSSRLVLDALGNLYGTTSSGGSKKCGDGFGCGLVYKLDSSGNEVVLHRFTNGADGGGENQADLLLDAAGNLYGTAPYGGSGGGGVVFSIALGSANRPEPSGTGLTPSSASFRSARPQRGRLGMSPRSAGW